MAARTRFRRCARSAPTGSKRRWNRTGEYRRPRILFLADRNIRVDDPRARLFAPFGDARHKIAGGDASQSRDMCFRIYQAPSTANEEVFRQYRPDFFDLIIIDEGHCGSSRTDSNWRAVLDYLASAVQFGVTATSLREESRDSDEYLGNPVYTYSLRQGIEDGLLAPYRVHRVITTVDAARRAAAHSVNAVMTATYWQVGRRIVEFEQGGQGRAAYGEDVIKRLGSDLSRQFGRGFGWRKLAQVRAF
jgi:superfamily II DNA or RNA helicase